MSEYRMKRILPVHQDLAVATSWSVDFKNLGFEPDEVRVLQYGAVNIDAAEMAGGVIVCDELKDFFLIIAVNANSAITQQTKLSCPTQGPLSQLNFRFCLTGRDAKQDVQDVDVWMVLEFLKR